MGAKTTMEKRGHHICRIGGYEIRQKINKPSKTRFNGKLVVRGGSSEISIYKGKKVIEGKLPSVSIAAQKAYDMQKSEGKNITVSKRDIVKYGLNV